MASVVQKVKCLLIMMTTWDLIGKMWLSIKLLICLRLLAHRKLSILIGKLVRNYQCSIMT
uniref:Uncharacterized protein n=1 Tax=Setaria italica TaxID=4555 RepID=K4A3T2_SETIT